MKKTIIDLFEQSVQKYADNPFLWEKTSDRFEPTTYQQVRTQVLALGAGLQQLGIKPKECVSILSEGRNAWIISELALLYAGAISVPLSIKLEESNDLYFRLNHGDVVAIFVSANQLEKVRAIRSQLPRLKHVIIYDEVAELQDGETTMSAVADLGRANYTDDFLKIGRTLQNDDIATITYTSGTTADPKGVVLTHRNYTANAEQALTRINIPPYYKTLIILPLDHCFAHVVGFYIMIMCGASVATVQVGKTPLETLKNVPVNIKEFEPYFLLSVPALAKNFRKNIEKGIKDKGMEGLFKFALKISYAYNKDGYRKGTGAAALLKPIVWLFDKLIYSKVRVAFGSNLKFFIGGGALLDAELQRFFYAIGIPMFQGYGLSEATPVISTNTPKRHGHRFGSSGEIVQPLDIRIVDEERKDIDIHSVGEMVIRGENVMAGYWKNEKATAETVVDGWLYTGDMGYVGREDGLLYVMGRFKSLLISSDGEKYSPEGMEEALVDESQYIDQVILYNNQSPYTSALIVPNYAAVNGWLDKHNFTGEERAREAVHLIEGEINKYKKGGSNAGQFPERWLPSTFALLAEPFTEQNGLVNSTMKVVRGKVEKTYANRIEAMYGDQKDIYNPTNLSVFAQ